jgi:3D (Asp-Asp-Asp) domain-containing protein
MLIVGAEFLVTVLLVGVIALLLVGQIPKDKQPAASPSPSPSIAAPSPSPTPAPTPIIQQTVVEQVTVIDKRVDLGEFTLTFYTPTDCPGKYTASGAPVYAGVSVAVDPSVIPLGTYIYIEGYGYRVAQDTGSGVKGKHIDIYMMDYKQAIQNGVQHAKVYKLED